MFGKAEGIASVNKCFLEKARKKCCGMQHGERMGGVAEVVLMPDHGALYAYLDVDLVLLVRVHDESFLGGGSNLWWKSRRRTLDWRTKFGASRLVRVEG